MKTAFDRFCQPVPMIALLTLTLFGGVGFADGDVCFHCGMTREHFGHSWVVIEFDSGRSSSACSIHCAAIEMVLNKDELVNNILVGDYHRRRMIDAFPAYWVIGGDLPGVMTTRAKWAFADKADASAFVRRHGGRLAVFEEVIRAAFEDLYEDTLAIKRKRKMTQMERSAKPEQPSQ